MLSRSLLHKSRHNRLFALFFLSLGMGAVSASAGDQWTSVEEHSIEAELLGTDGTSMVLRTIEDERIFVFGIERLKADDRERAVSGDAPRLPAFDLDVPPTDRDVEAVLAVAGELSGDTAAVAAYLRRGLASLSSP